MKNIFIYLIGFPGTGKYTTALELQKQEPSLCIMDNHLINNVLFTILDEPIPKRAWKNITKIWDIVFDTLKKDASPNDSFIMTNVLMQENKGDQKFYQKVLKTAQKRKSVFIPVRLVCDNAELEKRIINPARALRHKLMDLNIVREMTTKYEVLHIKHPNLLTLDTTHLSVAQTASAILQHAHGCLK
jgi:hypothetical protein